MKLLHEPLLHFLLIGALIFALFGFVKRHDTEKPGEITVTQGALENMVTAFSSTWQRPPRDEELRGLVRDYVREEAAYREALAIGLDRDDTIIRRRLQQKLEFVTEDLAAQAQPSDADLQAFLDSHPEKFRVEPTISFRHVYLNPQTHGANLQHDETRLLEELRRDGSHASTDELGDPSVLKTQFTETPFSEVKQTFGDQFTEALARLRPGDWQGPVQSAYGVHLVYVSGRADGRVPRLSEVRDEVRREWFNARRVEAMDKMYDSLLKRYTVRMEPPEEKKVAQIH